MSLPPHKNRAYSVYVGIDPGESGGIAILSDAGACLAAVPMSKSIPGVWEFIRDIPANSTTKVMIESVHAYPGQGAVSTWKFGMHYGMLIGMLTAHFSNFRLESCKVSPQKWQGSYLGLPKRQSHLTAYQNKKRLKDALISRARKYYPEFVPSTQKGVMAVSDALLIARYAWKEYA